MQVSFLLGWRQVLVCFMMLAASGMIAMTYSIIAVPLAEEYQPSRAVLMLTMTVLSGASAIMAPVLGSLMDKAPLKLMLLYGAASLGLGYAGLSITASFNHVLIIFALLIAPANVLLGPVAASVLLSRWFVNHRGKAIGVAVAGISAGGVVFPNIIQALLDGFEWRQALQILGVILTCWTACAALMVIDHPKNRGLNPDGAVNPPADVKAETAIESVSPMAVLAHPAFWAIVVTVAVVTAGMKGMITNLAPLVMDAGIAAKDAAPLISVFAAGSFIAKLNFAALADRIGPHKLMATALVGFALGIGSLTQAHLGFWMIAVGVGLIGLFGGLMLPMEAYLAPRVFGQKVVGRVMGILSGVILVAMLSTPPLFGFIFDLTGSYQGLFWTFSVLALGMLFAVPMIKLRPSAEDV